MSSTLVDDARDRAFERLYARHVRDVYRYALSVVRNPAEAEDVTQTTFLNAYRAIQAGAEPRLPQNWLIAIAHNACRSRVRFAMRRPREVALDDVTEVAMHEPERLNIRELLRAFGRLPSNQRAALTLREFEGRSYPEIAETLGVTVPAVEALIVRARKTLRRQAATLRGTLAAFLPRTGDLGAGAASKAAAILVVGVVGVVPGGAGRPETGKTHPQPAVQPIVAPSVPAVPRHVHAATHHAHVLPAARRAQPVTRAHPELDAAPPTAATPSASPPPASPSPVSPPSSAPPTAPSGPAGLPVAVPDLPVALPELPNPPVQPPDPPVQLPQLPDLPKLPSLPAQVFPGSGI
jgi:RNA polymerase sigma-70 factor (ECF subfamily)